MEGERYVFKLSELNKSMKKRAYQENLHGKYEVLRDEDVESLESVKSSVWNVRNSLDISSLFVNQTSRHSRAHVAVCFWQPM